MAFYRPIHDVSFVLGRSVETEKTEKQSNFNRTVRIPLLNWNIENIE